MNQRIVLEHGNVKKLAETMGCTREMVSKSLNYKKDTTLARKIRHVALESFGGCKVG